MSLNIPTRPVVRRATLIALALFAAGACSNSPSQPSATSSTTTTSVTPTAPTIASITPNSTDVRSGASVNISGTGFTNASAVTFGDTPAVSFTVGSDALITATAPDCIAAGTVAVTVTNTVGTSGVSDGDQFTCGTNSLTALWVNASSVKGGTSLLGSVALALVAGPTYTLPLTASSTPANPSVVGTPPGVTIDSGTKVATFLITTSPVSARVQVVLSTTFQNQNQTTTFFIDP